MTGSHVAQGEADLETILQTRCGVGVNHFWLTHDDERHPAMSIFVRGDLASVHYFPSERQPGFRSVGGSIPGLALGGFTVFYMNSVAEEEEVPNDSIVPFASALAAAREFLRSKEKPTLLEWLEL